MYQFASGLNLFVLMNECQYAHNIHLMSVVLANNKGELGNFYMVVSTIGKYYDFEDLDLNILITNILSIQTGMASPGTVIRYKMYLARKESDYLLKTPSLTVDLFDYCPYSPSLLRDLPLFDPMN